MKGFFVILVFVNVHLLWAQDTLIKTNGEELYGKVWEITPDEVKFTPSDNPNGPRYGLVKKDIFIIKYKNGDKERILGNTQPPAAPVVQGTYSTDPTVEYDKRNRRQPIYVIKQTPPPIEILPGRIEEFSGEYYRGNTHLNRIQLFQLLSAGDKKREIQNFALKADEQLNASKGFGSACGALMAVGFALGGVSSGILFLADSYSNGSSTYNKTPLYQLISGTQIAGFCIGGMGVGSMVASIVLKESARKNMSKAIAIYNEKYP